MTEEIGFAFRKSNTKMSKNEVQNLAKLGYAKPISWSIQKNSKK